MARRLLLGISVVALAVLFSGVAQAIIYTDPAVISIPDVNLRMMQTSASVTGTSTLTVNTLGKASGYIISTADSQIALSGTLQATLKAGAKTSLPYTISFTPSSYTLGSHTGIVSVAGDGAVPATILDGDATITANVLQNRTLVTNNLGSVAEPYRVVAKAVATKTTNGGATNLSVGTGSDPSAADNISTRVNVLAKGKSVINYTTYDPVKMKDVILNTATLTYQGANPTQFNGQDQTANLGATFTKAGHWEGTFDLSAKDSKGKDTMLGNGEAVGGATGAQLNAALVNYNVDVLDRRKVKGTASLNLLLNASTSVNELPATFVVDTGNKKNLDYLTKVLIGKDSPTVVVQQKDALKVMQDIGAATVTQRLIEGSDTWNMRAKVDMTITTAQPLLTPIQLATYGKPKVNPLSIVVPVDTGEEASAGDYKYDKKTGTISSAYKSLKLATKVNVGNAMLSKLAPTTFAPDTMVLSGNFGAGAILGANGKLASQVDAANKFIVTGAPDEKASSPLIKNSVKVSDILLKGKQITSPQLYGAVGSEAAVITSTALATDTTVTMEWRARTLGEAGAYLAGIGTKDSTLTNGLDWLISDVVRIGSSAGSLDDVYYALRMTGDNRIALMIDGTTNGLLENDWQSFFVAQLKDVGGTEKWVKAGAGDGHRGTIEEFLALPENAGKTLDQLVGSWGVENTLGGKQGATVGSWVIVKGGGTFAVAPEPSTLVLIGTVGLGLIGYGVRRWRRRQA